MIITRLCGRHFKGQTFDHKLSKINIFAGKNRTGKSARIEALSYAALGYIPYDPEPIRDPRTIFDLYGWGGDLSVGFETDGDINVARSLVEVDGSVRYHGPKGPVLPAIGFDPSVYFGLSGPKRLKFLCRATAGNAPFDREKALNSLVAELKNVKLELNSAKTEKAINETCAAVRAIKVMETEIDWIEEVLSIAKTRKAVADQAVKRMASTIAGNAQTAQQVIPPPDAEAVATEKRKIRQFHNDEVIRLSTLLDSARKEYREVDSKVLDGKDEQLLKIETLRKLIGDEFVPRSVNEMNAARLARRREGELMASIGANALKLDGFKEEIASLKSSTCSKCGHKIAAKETKKIKDGIKKQIKTCEDEVARDQELIAKVVIEVDLANKADSNESNARELESLETIMASHNAAIAALPAIKQTGIDLAAKLKAAEEKLSIAATEAADAEALERALLASRGEKAARARVQEQADNSAAEAAIAKAFCGIVTERQSKMVSDSIDPIISRINEFCGSFIPGKAKWEDEEIKIASWSHRTASDSEKLALFCAVSLALAMASPVRVGMISRLEAFDFESQGKLLALVDGLIDAGKLDQFFAAQVRVIESEDEIGATRFSNLKVFNL